MINSFPLCTHKLEVLFTALEQLIDKPVQVQYGDWYVYRYKEETLEVALVQKLFRIITGLKSAELLLRNGFTQEVATMQRVLDDLNEEVMFLVTAKFTHTWGKTHDKFLEGFFAETFADPKKPISALEIKRPFVSRLKIREALEESRKVMVEQGAQVDDTSTASRVLSKVFNGFAHAGSPQILESYGGDPPHYHLNGMLGTPRIQEYTESLWNNYFRGAQSFSFVCALFGKPDLNERVDEILAELESTKA